MADISKFSTEYCSASSSPQTEWTWQHIYQGTCSTHYWEMPRTSSGHLCLLDGVQLLDLTLSWAPIMDEVEIFKNIFN